MMKRFCALILLLLLFCAGPAFAGSGSAVGSVLYNDGHWIWLQWVCTASADATGTVSDPTVTGIDPNTTYRGIIYRYTIIPGSGGDQPDTLYDVELHAYPVETITRDFLGGGGDNLTNTVTYMDMPVTEKNGCPMVVFNEGLKPYANNCGNANIFTLRILIKKF